MDELRATNSKEQEDLLTAAVKTVSDIVKSCRSKYVEKMEELLDADYKNPNTLQRWHRQKVSKVIESYKVKVATCNLPDALVLEHQNLLETSMNNEFEKIEELNNGKLTAIEKQFEENISFAVRQFRERVFPILKNMKNANVNQLIGIHGEILQSALEVLEEEDFPDGATRKRFRKKLEMSLAEALDESKDMVRTSKEARNGELERIVLSFHQNYLTKLTDTLGRKWKDGGFYEETEFDEEVRQLSKKFQNDLKTKIEDSVDGETHFRRFDQLLHEENERAARDNQARRKTAHEDGERAVGQAKLQYCRDIRKIEVDATTLQEIESAHLRLRRVAVESLGTDGGGHMIQNKTLLNRFKQELTTQLDREFQSSLKIVQRKEEEHQRLVQVSMVTVEEEYESQFRRWVADKTFLSDGEIETKHEELMEEQVHHLKSSLKSNFSNDPMGLRNIVLRLESVLNAKKKMMAAIAKKTSSEANEGIKQIVECCTSSFQESLKSLVSAREISRTEFKTNCTQLMNAIERMFDDRWILPSGQKKDQTSAKLKQMMKDECKKIDENHFKVQEQIKEVMDMAVSSLCQQLEQDQNQGFVYTNENLDSILSAESIDVRKRLQEYIEKRGLEKFQEKILDDLNTKLLEQLKRSRDRNAENLKLVENEIQALLTSLSKSKVGHIYKRQDLLDFEAEMKQKAIQHFEGKSPKLGMEKFTVLHQSFETAVKACFENLVSTLLDRSESQTLRIIELAHTAYEEEMGKQLEGKPPVHPDTMVMYNRRGLQASIKEAENRFIVISEVQKQLIRQRVANTFRILDNKNKLRSAQSDNLAIGIDLGTTTSCVAIYENGQAKVLKDISGRNLIPSYVYFPLAGEPNVGHEAKQAAVKDPENVIFDAKRLIGRPFSDPNVQSDIVHWPFEVQDDGSDKPVIVVRGKKYTPEDISARVLARVKKVADAYLPTGKTVSKAVITVPANFTDPQRDATREAATKAGLQVLQIINEPTAAAIAHHLTWKDAQRNVLVFDFGGGTFDVTVCVTGDFDHTPPSSTSSSSSSESMDKGLGRLTPKPKPRPSTPSPGGSGLRVITTDGDTHLGGEDFDSNMVKYCVAEFKRLHGIDLLKKTPGSTGSDSPRAVNGRLRRLRDKCENVKRNLTEMESGNVILDAMFGETDLDVTITRAQFEQMNMKLFKNAIRIVKKALAEAKMDKNRIDDVIMVGGSSRIPVVRKMLADFLERPEISISQLIDMQEAVALGAAVQACILNGGELANKIKKIQDIQPFTLGIEVKGGVMSKLIPRNCPIPTEKRQTYVTTEDNQEVVDICVFSGENQLVSQNSRLGSFKLSGIPPSDAGTQEVDVSMKIDDSGILTVTAICTSNGVTTNLVIEKTRG